MPRPAFACGTATSRSSSPPSPTLQTVAKNQAVSELAAVMLDKTLFGLATGSFQGTFGALREAGPAFLRSGRFAAESCLGYLLWGLGRGGSALDGAREPGPGRERLSASRDHPGCCPRSAGGDVGAERHLEPGPGGVSTVTYKTPDYVLSSAQDYRPGERGGSEQVWQATLGPDALVFANHPGSFSEAAGRPAGWWSGNDSLPRVAQWKDALIALYDVPDGCRLPFTHTYFPLYAFDEWTRDGAWAFARKGDGYLALYAAQGMELVVRGQDAHRELRLAGRQNVWLCQMGRQALDGSFREFRERVVAKGPVVNGLNVEWETVRGEKLSFGWTGHLLVNGEAQDVTAFKHYESLYAVAELPAQTMDIVYGDQLMRLKFI